MYNNHEVGTRQGVWPMTKLRICLRSIQQLKTGEVKIWIQPDWVQTSHCDALEALTFNYHMQNPQLFSSPAKPQGSFIWNLNVYK